MLDYLKNRDYERFLLESSKVRKEANLYPFCKVCLLRLSGENYEDTENTAIILANYLESCFKERDWKVIGPAPGLISKVGNKYRWQILLHGPEKSEFPLPDKSLLWKLIPKNIFLTIDLNPTEL